MCFLEECVRYYEDKKKINGWEAGDKFTVLMDSAPSNVAAAKTFCDRYDRFFALSTTQKAPHPCCPHGRTTLREKG